MSYSNGQSNGEDLHHAVGKRTEFGAKSASDMMVADIEACVEMSRQGDVVMKAWIMDHYKRWQNKPNVMTPPGPSDPKKLDSATWNIWKLWK